MKGGPKCHILTIVWSNGVQCDEIGRWLHLLHIKSVLLVYFRSKGCFFLVCRSQISDVWPEALCTESKIPASSRLSAYHQSYFIALCGLLRDVSLLMPQCSVVIYWECKKHNAPYSLFSLFSTSIRNYFVQVGKIFDLHLSSKAFSGLRVFGKSLPWLMEGIKVISHGFLTLDLCTMN